MSDLVGRRVVFAVGQLPFEAQSEDGQYNLFCTLVPVAFDTGELAESQEFPNNGLVWWMVRPNARGMAEPGRLLTGVLEPAHRFDSHDPDKMFYQVRRDTVELVREDDCIEILTASDASFGEARDIVNHPGVVVLDHPPTVQVLLRWRGILYGPFHASHGASADGSRAYPVSFRCLTPSQEVYRISEGSLLTIGSGHIAAVSTTVALDAQNRRRAQLTATCSYELLFPNAWGQLRQAPLERVPLESDQEILRKVAKQLLTRKRRQELSALLDQLGGAVGAPATLPSDDAIIEAVRTRMADEDVALQSLAKALLESGLLEDRITTELRQRFEQHLEERAAEAQAEIQQRLEALRHESESVSRDIERQRAEQDSREKQSRTQLEAELRESRSRVAEEQRQREDEIQRKLDELGRQREILTANLATVADRFAQARSAVVNDFLELVPLLEQTGLLPDRHAAGPDTARVPERAAEAVEEFELPAFVFRRDESPGRCPTEDEFIERLKRHVQACGFVYRDAELASFHVSVKTNDLTVLGGLSGTGKSTLPRLYSEALAGSSAERGARYLHVGVSPSWMDMRDLLGHVNAIERKFDPAESGLFRHLAAAAEEFATQGQDSGLHFVCLDEMNLAHVEHYFSGFLQALEMPQGQRVVRVFDPLSVSSAGAFRRWSSLTLPDSLRFVGTVNLDETTKQLSLRLLDRVNFIRLRPQHWSAVPVSQTSSTRPEVDGPPVNLACFRNWRRSMGLADPQAATLIDRLRPHLEALGCPLNPRRYRALCEFVASTPAGLCSTIKALDLQIAQRFLPQVRGLFRREAAEAVKGIRGCLEGHEPVLEESLAVLAEIEDREFGTTRLEE